MKKKKIHAFFVGVLKNSKKSINFHCWTFLYGHCWAFAAFFWRRNYKWLREFQFSISLEFHLNVFRLIQRSKRFQMTLKSLSQHFWLFGRLDSYFSFVNRAKWLRIILQILTMNFIDPIGIDFQLMCNASTWHFCGKPNSPSSYAAMQMCQLRDEHSKL